MSKYSKEDVREKLKSFSPKEIKAFKRLVQEFNYPIDKALDKILELKSKHQESKREIGQAAEDSGSPSSNRKRESENRNISQEKLKVDKRVAERDIEKEEIVKNEGGQNVIKSISSDEFELIGMKENIEPPSHQKRTKEFSENEIIPVVDSQKIEVEALTPKEREIYDKLIKYGRSHEDALKEAYRERKKELSEKIKSLEAFYNIL
jgi:hypothetical protein